MEAAMKTFVTLSMLLGLTVASAVPATAQGTRTNVTVDPGTGAVIIFAPETDGTGIEGDIHVVIPRDPTPSTPPSPIDCELLVDDDLLVDDCGR
jgi:hypothetical protein